MIRTPNDPLYKIEGCGYKPQKLGFDNRRPFNMGLHSQNEEKSSDSPFKVKKDEIKDFKPHMMYKDGDEVMAKTYEKHLELKKKGYGHTKPKSPVKKRGLWDNIHAKRKRGEKMRKKGDEGAPTEKAIKESQSPNKQKNTSKNGNIVYKNGKKYYKASDGTLHTGQVSDYEAELAADKKNKQKKPSKGKGFMKPPYKDTVKGTRPYAKRQGYHGYTDFTSNVTGKKVKSPNKNKVTGKAEVDLLKKGGFGPRAAKGSDDQSKTLAKSRYEMGQYKNDPTAPPTTKRKAMKDGAKAGVHGAIKGGVGNWVPYSQRKKK